MMPGVTLEKRLRRELRGDVLFDAASRGRYATDASIYQIEPVGVVIPRDSEDALRALDVARDHGVAILPRGAGTSQCGQTVGEALVIDCSRHLTATSELDIDGQSIWAEPGVVLDRLNAELKPHGLWHPVDVSTSAQATIGGMAGNNSCGARSIRYGNMVHNVLAVDAWLPNGTTVRFGTVPPIGEAIDGPPVYRHLIDVMRGLHAAEEAEIARRVPKLLRRVAGYNLDLVSSRQFNAASLLVGSEGTLAFSRRVKLRLAPLPASKTLGVVHFPTFYSAMQAVQHIVALDPAAVELVDRTMIDLSRRIAAFRATVDSAIRGEPEAVLLVEFASDDAGVTRARLAELSELMADLGLPGSVVDVDDPQFQSAIWSVRKAGLNIMMSMKGDGKPVSFIEDCAVPLEHLADYTARLTEVFAKHGTSGTWYAHASVGCLHVRPVLDMRAAGDVRKMREIAEAACAMVREYKGSYSGEHGDGLVRSEWIGRMYGDRLSAAFGALKKAFDPAGIMNPGKIVDPPPMDDRSLFRYRPGYATLPIETGLDWSAHEVGEGNAGRGFAAAVEMCNNNGHCRKLDAGTMCPSYRATRDERDLTRGRANTLRLALSGQLGADALHADELYRTMDLCLSCKGCRRECPTGVDMARMKVEFLHQYHRSRPRRLKDRLVADLPRAAPRLARFAPLVNLRDRVPGLAAVSQWLLGFAARRSMPVWRRDWFRGQSEVDAIAGSTVRAAANAGAVEQDRLEVALLPDTFNTWFEPGNLRAAVRVLCAAGYDVIVPEAAGGARPLCCGRTWLGVGMLDEARAELRRTLTVLLPLAQRGVPIVGLEPSCLLTFRDELAALLPEEDVASLASACVTFEEFLLRLADDGRLPLALGTLPYRRALLHGHCHQKSFGLMGDVKSVLAAIPGLEVEEVPSGCCGLAGAFGYDVHRFDLSMRVGEEVLLPAVRAAGEDTVIVADGTSCRHQILDGAGREARHVASVLAEALVES